MKKSLLLILLTALPLPALSATCPQGVLEGKVHNGGNYGEEFYSCYQGKIYPKTLMYCAPNSGGDEGFYNPLDYKCVNQKVMGKQQDYCYKGDLGKGGIFGTVDQYCKKGGIYYKLNNFKTN